jgi:hypothetical protein
MPPGGVTGGSPGLELLHGVQGDSEPWATCTRRCHIERHQLAGPDELENLVMRHAPDRRKVTGREVCVRGVAFCSGS